MVDFPQFHQQQHRLFTTLASNDEEAIKDFEALELKDIRDISDKKGYKKLGFLNDGTTVIVRDHSNANIPTLEMQISKNKYIKFRYTS